MQLDIRQHNNRGDNLFDNDLYYKIVDNCPWCGSKNSNKMFDGNSFSVKKCNECGFVFSSKILNNEGLSWYWSNYESNVHSIQKEMTQKRKEMYKLEFQIIDECLNDKAKLLDVGCANGDFLLHFADKGYECEGVEFGEEAYKQAAKLFLCYQGDINSVPEGNRYDCIIFRGVIQYLLNPKKDLERAVGLLNEGGYIYITSSPNADSFLFNLFKDKFILPVDPLNYYMYTEPLLTKFFESEAMVLFKQKWLYKGTPYENFEADIKAISNAISEAKNGEIISKCPAFYDNMLTLVYRKQAR